MRRTDRLFFPFLFLFTLTVSLNVFAQTPAREDLQNQIQAKRDELAALEKQFLAASDADKTEFASLLSQPGTGVIRLMPRELYDSEVYKNNKKTLTIRGGGAYYSFTRLTHEYGAASDIELDSGHLSVGFAGANYGMLLKLGDVAIEDVSLDLPAIRTLLDYTPAANEPDARKEQHRFSTGAELQGFVYKDRLPLETNTTYVLRSISYHESDTAVVVRVVRKDSDGSAILAFKVLKRFSTPKLARN